MDLPLSDFRRMEVEEFEHIKIARACEQAGDRTRLQGFSDRRCGFASLRKRIDRRNSRLHGRSGIAAAGAQCAAGQRQSVGHAAGRSWLSGYGRACHALLRTRPGRDRSRCATRHRADTTVDGRHWNRRGGDVSHADASTWGSHPQVEVEVALARAYNRWLIERVLAHEPRIRSMLYLPFNDAEASFRMVQEFGQANGVVGFMVTSACYRPVHHNSYMKTYALWRR